MQEHRSSVRTSLPLLELIEDTRQLANAVAARRRGRRDDGDARGGPDYASSLEDWSDRVEAEGLRCSHWEGPPAGRSRDRATAALPLEVHRRCGRHHSCMSQYAVASQCNPGNDCELVRTVTKCPHCSPAMTLAPLDLFAGFCGVGKAALKRRDGLHDAHLFGSRRRCIWRSAVQSRCSGKRSRLDARTRGSDWTRISSRVGLPWSSVAIDAAWPA